MIANRLPPQTICSLHGNSAQQKQNCSIEDNLTLSIAKLHINNNNNNGYSARKRNIGLNLNTGGRKLDVKQGRVALAISHLFQVIFYKYVMMMMTIYIL